jgi:sigma-B regulation protein RsbU (phosphoserine phosphatase)
LRPRRVKRRGTPMRGLTPLPGAATVLPPGALARPLPWVLEDRMETDNELEAVSQTYMAETILKEISDVVSSIDDVQSVMQDLVRLTTSLLNVSNCSLVMREPGTEEMRIRAAHGISPEVIKNYRARIGEGITGWVARTGKPLLIENVETHPLFQRTSRNRYSTKSLLSVPLLFQREVIGVLNVNNRKDGGVFSKADELLLSVLANFVVIAIEKARMRERLIDQERYEAELRVAREIQESILPKELPSKEHWEFAARYVPARAVAGDFFDAIPLPDNRCCVVLGDVCGKGVPAALYMARVLGYYRVVAQVKQTSADIMAFVNDLLAAEWSERTFVTAVLCVFDNVTGRISFCSAGHPTPYVLRESLGKVMPVEISHGLPLGIETNIPYESSEFDTYPGDTFVLYTDGITEAKSAESGDLFREERLVKLMEAHRGSADDLARKILDAVVDFAGAEAQADDLTLVVIKRT